MCNSYRVPVQKKYRGIVTLKLRIFYTHTCLYVWTCELIQFSSVFARFVRYIHHVYTCFYCRWDAMPMDGCHWNRKWTFEIFIIFNNKRFHPTLANLPPFGTVQVKSPLSTSNHFTTSFSWSKSHHHLHLLYSAKSTRWPINLPNPPKRIQCSNWKIPTMYCQTRAETQNLATLSWLASATTIKATSALKPP